jgi:hypothetical protein
MGCYIPNQDEEGVYPSVVIDRFGGPKSKAECKINSERFCLVKFSKFCRLCKLNSSLLTEPFNRNVDNQTVFGLPALAVTTNVCEDDQHSRKRFDDLVIHLHCHRR